MLKLQQLQQENMSVNEYFKDLKEIILNKVNMHESDGSMIARFVSGLRREIQDVVELYEYTTLEKLVHLTIKVESQLLKKNYFKTIDNDEFYKSSRFNSPTSLKTPNEDECEVPCEGDLLVVRHMLGKLQNILMKLKEKTFFIPVALSTSSYVV